MTFCDRVKAILTFKKIHQVDFARMTGIHQSRLSMLLSGKRKPTSKELMKIVEVINVPYECLIGKVPLFDELLQTSISVNYLW